jgi:hypothetical protein
MQTKEERMKNKETKRRRGKKSPTICTPQDRLNSFFNSITRIGILILIQTNIKIFFSEMELIYMYYLHDIYKNNAYRGDISVRPHR